MLRVFLLITCVLFSATTLAQNPVQSDGDKYKVVLENERVRVLEYRDQPGQKTQQHHHPAFVLYALSPFKRSITLPDGKVIMRQFKTGDVIYSEAQTHVGENVGDTETHVIMIELKEEPPASAQLK